MKFEIEAKRYQYSNEVDICTVENLDNALAEFAKRCETHEVVSMKKVNDKRTIHEEALKELFT